MSLSFLGFIGPPVLGMLAFIVGDVHVHPGGLSREMLTWDRIFEKSLDQSLDSNDLLLAVSDETEFHAARALLLRKGFLPEPF